MAIINIHENGRQAQLTFPGMDRPSLYTTAERASRLGYILRQFKESFQTETAYWLTYQALSAADRDYLANYWALRDDWEVFRKLCRLYGVKVA